MRIVAVCVFAWSSPYRRRHFSSACWQYGSASASLPCSRSCFDQRADQTECVGVVLPAQTPHQRKAYDAAIAVSPQSANASVDGSGTEATLIARPVTGTEFSCTTLSPLR